MRIFAAPFAFALLALFPAVPAQAQTARPADPFIAACMAKKNTSQVKCACQAKIARANLDRREQQAALLAVRGEKEAFTKQVKSFGEAKAKVFAGKMQKLGEQSKAQCN